jgi:hypothetical protein
MGTIDTKSNIQITRSPPHLQQKIADLCSEVGKRELPDWGKPGAIEEGVVFAKN